MRNHTFQQITFNPSIKPLNELMTLNIKTLQSLSYLTPEELLNTRKPEELFEKNMNIFINNARKTLDYMQDMFSIVEKNWMNLSQDMVKKTQHGMDEIESVTRSKLNEAMNTGERATRIMTSNVNTMTKKTVKQAKKNLSGRTTKAALSSQKNMKQAASVEPKKKAIKSKKNTGLITQSRAMKGKTISASKH